MDRAGIYNRVSDKKNDLSPEQQEEEARDSAHREGWRIAGVWSDKMSASRYESRNRPEWDNFRERVKAGDFDVAVLWEPSRGSRELDNWAGFLNVCRDTGTRIYITARAKLYDMTDSSDYRTLAYDGVDSVLESEKTSARTRRGVAQSVSRGDPYGRKPFGYARTYTRETGRPKPVVHQAPDPITAPIVREIITRIAGGDAISAIRADLNARGVPKPKNGKRSNPDGRWAHSTITRMVLDGAVYIGKRRHNGSGLLDGNWPALVDEPTYWKAVNVLSDPARKTMANDRGGIRPGAARWLLSYIAKCDKCRAPLSVTTRPRQGQMVAMYRCASSAGGCAMAPVEWLDFCVSEAVIKWASKPGRYEAIMTGNDAEAAAARDEASAERARLAEFEQQAIASKLGAESFARILAGIEARISDLDARSQDGKHPARDLLAEGSAEDNVRACWEGMPLTSRRRVVSALTAEPGHLRLEPVNGRSVADLGRVRLRFADDPR